jgi:hypothetical protein
MRIRLLKKLAAEIDGVDLSAHGVGDVINLPAEQAKLLLAEGWAIREHRVRRAPTVVAFRRTTDPGRIHDEEL